MSSSAIDREGQQWPYEREQKVACVITSKKSVVRGIWVHSFERVRIVCSKPQCVKRDEELHGTSVRDQRRGRPRRGGARSERRPSSNMSIDGPAVDVAQRVDTEAWASALSRVVRVIIAWVLAFFSARCWSNHVPSPCAPARVTCTLCTVICFVMISKDACWEACTKGAESPSSCPRVVTTPPSCLSWQTEGVPASLADVDRNSLPRDTSVPTRPARPVSGARRLAPTTFWCSRVTPYVLDRLQAEARTRPTWRGEPETREREGCVFSCLWRPPAARTSCQPPSWCCSTNTSPWTAARQSRSLLRRRAMELPGRGQGTRGRDRWSRWLSVPWPCGLVLLLELRSARRYDDGGCSEGTEADASDALASMCKILPYGCCCAYSSEHAGDMWTPNKCSWCEIRFQIRAKIPLKFQYWSEGLRVNGTQIEREGYEADVDVCHVHDATLLSKCCPGVIASRPLKKARDCDSEQRSQMSPAGLQWCEAAPSR